MSDVMVYVSFGLGLLSMVLHFIAPKTKNTKDDKAAELVDEAAKILPTVTNLMPKMETKPAAGFDVGPTIRDHR